jgi:Ca2+/Na+ antiporter
MNQRNYGMYALAAAIVVVAALIVGASLESLVWLALVAACPLMMFFMMKSMHSHDTHGGHSRDDRDDDLLHRHDQHQHPGSGRR